MSEAARVRAQEMRMLARQPALLTVIVLVMVSLLLFSMYPLISIFSMTLRGPDGFDLSVVSKVLGTPSFYVAFRNSATLGVVSAFIATVVGYVFAFAVARTAIPGRRFFHLVAMLPIISPPFVIALSVILLFGRSGVITRGIFGITDTNVYGFWSLLFVQVMSFYPLAYLNLRGVLESIDSSVEDAARNCGASRGHVFRTITLALSMPAVFSSLLLVFIKSISDFGNPQVLAGGYSVLSVQAYIQIVGLYDMRTGAFMAFTILLPSILAFLIQKYWVSKRSYVSVTGKPSAGSGQITSATVVVPLLVFCVLVAAFVLMFYGTVVWISLVNTWGVDMSLSFKNYAFALARGINAIRDSLVLAAIATPLTAIFGVVIAYLLIRKQFIGKKFIELSSMLSYAVPGIVLGIGYAIAFNRPPIVLSGTASIIVIAMIFRNLSVGLEAGSNSLRQIDPSIEDASTNLGASTTYTFFHITVPLIKTALYSGLVNAFVRSMTAISAVIFLVSVNWNLLTVSILSEIEGSRLGIAAAYCTILMLIVLASFQFLNLFVNRISARGGV